jgi:hypothetical protein
MIVKEGRKMWQNTHHNDYENLKVFCCDDCEILKKFIDDVIEWKFHLPSFLIILSNV